MENERAKEPLPKAATELSRERHERSREILTLERGEERERIEERTLNDGEAEESSNIVYVSDVRNVNRSKVLLEMTK